MDSELTGMFERSADRWYPLIYRGAIEYSVPSKLDVEDLVQEGLLLLYDTIKTRVVEKDWFSIDSVDFEKWFKTALFHRFIDRKRSLTARVRDIRKEVRVTEEYDPFSDHAVGTNDLSDRKIIADDMYEKVIVRLSEQDQKVLECLARPSDEFLSFVRKCKCTECLYEGDPTPTGECPDCLKLSREFPDTFVKGRLVGRSFTSTRSEIQGFLGYRSSTITDAIYRIRREFRNLGVTPNATESDIQPLMCLLGYDTIPSVTDDSRSYPLTYTLFKSVLNESQIRILDFVVLHTSNHYKSMGFSELARRVGMSIHDSRKAVDGMRIKVEFIIAGCSLLEIPREV